MPTRELTDWSDRTSTSTGVLAGLATGAVTVGLAELGVGLMQRGGRTGGTPSPIDALGGAFVDRTPAWLKDAAIAAFGTNDKAALYAGIEVVLVLFLGVAAAAVLS